MSGSRTTWLRAGLLGAAAAIAICALPGAALNANLDTSLFADAARKVAAGQVPYRDFSLEYPPGSLIPIVLPQLAGADHYADAFKALEMLFVALMIVGVAFAASRVGLTARRIYASSLLTAAGFVLLGPVLLIRFDPWPALLTVAAIATLISTRRPIAFGLLGAAVATKLFPLVLLPVFWTYLASRSSGKRSLAAFLLGGAAFTMPFALLGPGGVASSLERQLGRGLEVESLGASALLVLHQVGLSTVRVEPASGSFDVVGVAPTVLSWSQGAILIVVLVWIVVAFARSQRGSTELVRASAASVAAVVAFGKVLSPQFLVWVVPLVVLAVVADADIVEGAALLLVTVLTWILYPGLHEELVTLNAAPAWLLLARNLLLVGLAIHLASRLNRERAITPPVVAPRL